MKKEPLFIFGAFMFALGAFVFLENDVELTGHAVLDNVPEVVCKTIQVSYEDSDTIIVQEEYVDTVLEETPLSYDVVRESDYPLIINNQLGRFSIFGVKNLDSQSSNFVIRMIFSEESGESEEFVFSKILREGEVLQRDVFFVSDNPSKVSVSYFVETGYKLVSVEKVLTREVELPILISKVRSEEICE
ncbi:MAG: hypothetical protein GON13_03050 [Nanoarchaeota archaeon]|nr:hypothetical protein [Nanoarchaeota archaeon]